MRVTVAFYGIPRCTLVSAPSIEHHLLRPLKSSTEVSVVHHLWKIDQVTSARSGENATLPEDAYAYFEKSTGVVESPPRFEDGELFKSWTTFGDAFCDHFGSLRNLMHQLQSLKRVTALIQQTHPDVVVFARPDLQYHDDIPLSACRLAARFPSLCMVPIWNWWAGFNDRFAVCGKAAFQAYGNRLDQAVEFARAEGRAIHSESLVKFALRAGGVNTLAIPTTASRVRADGTVRQENFNSIETSTLWRGRQDRFDRLQCRLTRQVSKMIISDAHWHTA